MPNSMTATVVFFVLGTILLLANIFVLARDCRKWRIRAVVAETTIRHLQEDLDAANVKLANHDALS